MVIGSFNGNLYGNILDQLFALEEIPEREIISKDFDIDNTEVKQKKKPTIPPMSHPWKYAFYLAHLAKQKHRQLDANV